MVWKSILDGVALLISVFTPSHKPRFLDQCYESLKCQTHTDWEWVVLLNNGAYWRCGSENTTDPRVKVFNSTARGIGALKKEACARATGDVLVELDHDDLLAPQCLERVAEAFDKHRDAGFVYSSAARFRDDDKIPVPYGPDHGWEPSFNLGSFRGYTGWMVKAFSPTPQSLNRIWYAPDHVRAWRREAYDLIGGHNAELEACDDYELMVRTYLQTPFVEIPEALYWYREGDNSFVQPERNALIQSLQYQYSNQYRVQIAEAWAQRNGLALIDLCSAGNAAPGYLSIDTVPGLGDITADLDTGWPFDDNEVGVIRAQDALEHLKDKNHTMSEAWRVLAHGGWFFSDTPSTDGRGAFQDPSHVSFWNENAFWYWTSELHRSYLRGKTKPHFQVWQLETLFYNDWHKTHDIPYVRAHLSAIKDGPRLPGLYSYTP